MYSTYAHNTSKTIHTTSLSLSLSLSLSIYIYVIYIYIYIYIYIHTINNESHNITNTKQKVSQWPST